MEDTQVVYSHEYEIRRLNVQMGMDGTNSNGHGGENEEDINLAETIIKLQTDVQSHKADNERLMKVKEQHEDLNMNLMKSLDIIEKKLDKESGSIKSGSHKTPEEK